MGSSLTSDTFTHAGKSLIMTLSMSTSSHLFLQLECPGKCGLHFLYHLFNKCVWSISENHGNVIGTKGESRNLVWGHRRLRHTCRQYCVWICGMIPTDNTRQKGRWPHGCVLTHLSPVQVPFPWWSHYLPTFSSFHPLPIFNSKSQPPLMFGLQKWEQGL